MVQYLPDKELDSARSPADYLAHTRTMTNGIAYGRRSENLQTVVEEST